MGERDESIFHLVSECKKLAQPDYKQRHDSIAGIVHLELCQKHGLLGEWKLYNHRMEGVMENEDVKILLGFNIQTDHLIEHRRPDIVVVNKKDSPCDIIDVAFPGGKRVNLKEIEKIGNYSELRREVKKIWQLKEVRVIPIVIGSLGTISNNFESRLEKLNLKSSIELTQKAALLGTESS